MPSPYPTVALALFFLCCVADCVSAGESQMRLTPEEIAALPAITAGTGTSGVTSIRTTVLSGDPNEAGLYTIRLVIAPHTLIEPHHHRDNRVATVVSGLWYIGYGVKRDARCAEGLASRKLLHRASRSNPFRRYRKISRPSSTSPALGRATRSTSMRPKVLRSSVEPDRLWRRPTRLKGAISEKLVGPARTGIILGCVRSAALRPCYGFRGSASLSTRFSYSGYQLDGATIYVRVGGKGPAVVMLHGFGDTGDMWSPVAAVLVRDHTVIVPDLRGMGLSSHPESGYDKKRRPAISRK